MQRTHIPSKATEIRCAAYVKVLKDYQVVVAQTKDPEVKAYYTKVLEAGTKIVVALWEDDTVKLKILIARFVRTVSESKLTQPTAFGPLYAKILETRRLVQDRKEGPATGPKRRR